MTSTSKCNIADEPRRTVPPPRYVQLTVFRTLINRRSKRRQSTMFGSVRIYCEWAGGACEACRDRFEEVLEAQTTELLGMNPHERTPNGRAIAMAYAPGRSTPESDRSPCRFPRRGTAAFAADPWQARGRGTTRQSARTRPAPPSARHPDTGRLQYQSGCRGGGRIPDLDAMWCSRVS